MIEALGFSAVAIGLIGYVPYLIGMYRGLVKPHAFTWFLWGFVTGVAYAAQVSDRAGPGSWATGVTAVVCLLIAAGACRQSRFSNVSTADWYCLGLALLAIPLWVTTETPLYSVLLITFIDTVAYVPTFRKSWHHPDQEVLFTYVTATAKYLFSVAAMPEQTLISGLYPWSIIATNSGFILLVVYRRRIAAASSC
jgi:hypothetical protein